MQFIVEYIRRTARRISRGSSSGSGTVVTTWNSSGVLALRARMTHARRTGFRNGLSLSSRVGSLCAVEAVLYKQSNVQAPGFSSTAVQRGEHELYRARDCQSNRRCTYVINWAFAGTFHTADTTHETSVPSASV